MCDWNTIKLADATPCGEVEEVMHEVLCNESSSLLGGIASLNEGEVGGREWIPQFAKISQNHCDMCCSYCICCSHTKHSMVTFEVHTVHIYIFIVPFNYSFDSNKYQRILS